MTLPPRRLGQPRIGNGQFTFAQHDPAAADLLTGAGDRADEARQVFADAEQRAKQAASHARRAGVNLLAALAQAQDHRAAQLNLRWRNGRYTAEALTDADGGVVWSVPESRTDPISRAVDTVNAYIDEPGDAADSGVSVRSNGAATLPLRPNPRSTLDDIEQQLG
ncbi:hypothetical protein [Curtobacterium sp. MCBD17_040]|uniref:hypothetical protein n=1 Tax=Curtobacterium sp. MCBD17_040 TaxID=2175674 RepID=UPI000DA9E4F4|nr:hypothetical protein [Curtobacterium sp. MCBD17_040]WIB65696.1 hypothetical protein DEI94_16375 [Curtobacterium sp. MCBD17_040]